MATARYWRIVGVRTYAGGDLAITALRLHDDDGRADADATLTASVAPASGAVSDLQAAVPSTTVIWPAAAVAHPRFAVVWDFGTAVDITGLRIGAVDKARFPVCLVLQKSDDAIVWATVVSASRIAYPGAGELSATAEIPLDSNDALWLEFEGDDDSTDIVDAAGHTFTCYGGAKLSTSGPLRGASSLLLSTRDTDYVQAASNADFNLGTGAFTIRVRIKPSNVARYGGIVGRQSNTFYITREWIFSITSATTFQFYYGIRGKNQANTNFTVPFSMVNDGVYEILMGRDADGYRRCFVNGRLCSTAYSDGAVASDKTDLSAPNNNLPLTIGRFFGYTDLGFTGRIDSLRIRKGEAPPVSEIDYVRFTAQAPLAEGHAWAMPISGLRPTFSGSLVVTGTIKKEDTPTDTPLRRRVTLYEERSRRLVAETWSDAATGAYSFTDLDPALRYSAIGYDHEHNYRAVIADNLTPETMP